MVLGSDLQAFLRTSIRSTWSLELLLLLRKRAPAPLTTEALVRELRATPTLIATCAAQLEAAGLIACGAGGACRYAPATPLLEECCAQLEQAYAERPVTVINAIVASGDDKLKTFSDAFRFTKKDD